MKILPNIFKIFSDKNTRIFILCGGRRTGTTLLAGILSSDVRTNPLGQESQILTRVIESYRWGVQNFENFGRSFFPSINAYKDSFRKSINILINDISSFASNQGILILKNPELSKVLHSVKELFPEAILLTTMRDPRDQVAAELEVSRRSIEMGKNTQKPSVEFLSNLYNLYNKEILEMHSTEPHRIKTIKYEDLILRTKLTLSELEVFTDLKFTFDPNKDWPRVSTLAGFETLSPSSSQLYGKPLNAQSIGRYKAELSIEEINIIEEICNEIISKFQY